MPFFKRRYGGTSYPNKKRRVSGYRRKVGYRKYIRKAGTIRTRYPQRFRYSRRNYRLASAVAKTVRNLAETKVIPFRELNWTQPAAVATAPGVAQVKYLGGSTSTGTYGSYTTMGGFNAPQGDGKNNRDGQFIYLKGLTLNLTVQMDHLAGAGRASAIQFRVIVYKAKRALDPAGLTQNPDFNLFLQNNGSNFGDATASPDNMNPMDILFQLINTNSYAPICDRKFILQHPVESTTGVSQNIVQTNYLSTKQMRIRLTHNTKARIPLGSTDEPVDYNYRYAIAIYAIWTNQSPISQGDLPTTWSASVRGTTSFLDM